MSNLMFSVVTVCFNAEKEINETIRSVLKQTCSDYEYIVVDGKSTDRTMRLVNLMEECFLKRGISFTAISEKDNGIYCAMNKAIDMARGEYIVFINAGDRIYSETTLERVKSYINSCHSDFIIGDIVIKYRGLYRYKKAVFNGLNSIIDICHQSTYTRTQLLKERKYDESYALASDRDFFCYAVSSGKTVSVLHEPLSIYLEGGASASKKGLEEIRAVDLKYNIPHIHDTIRQTKQQSKNVSKRIKTRLQHFIPKFILERRHRRQMLNDGWSILLPYEEK